VDGTRTLSHAEVPDPLPAPGTAAARAVYDIPRPRPWGGHIAAYMVTKAVAAGALVAASIGAGSGVLLGWLSLVFTVLTVLLLIGDLHQPRRFFFLVTMPNTRSWLVRGGWVLTAHGLLSAAWALGAAHLALSVASVAVAVMTAVYTAFLFRQARGRELWCEDRLLPFLLGAQAMAAASALGFLLGEWSALWMIVHAALVLATALDRMPTPGAREGHRIMVRHPAFALGGVAAALAIAFPPLVFLSFALLDWIYVKAGQEVPIS